MNHYWFQVNCGVGVLLAGGWSLPVLATEVLPKSVVADSVVTESEQAKLQSQTSTQGMGAIAPNLPAQAVPEQFPPSATPLESTVASLAVTPPAAAEDNPSPPSVPASVGPGLSSSELSSLVILAASSDRVKPEFSQTIAPETFAPGTSTNAWVEPELKGAIVVASNGTARDGKSIIAQGEGEAAPLSEAASPLEEAETVLDNRNEVPAGDLLESVDGLEDSGIAGEGATTEEFDPTINRDAAGEAASDEGAQQPEPLVENREAEETLEAEDFDTEDFEAEDFEFDEDDDSESPPASTAEAEAEGDPELGILRLRERPLAKKKPPLKVPVFLVGNVGYIGNGNTLAGVDPVNDRLFRSGLSLIASPRLSKRTALIASVQGNLYRYDELSRLDYNEVRLQTSLRHVLTRKVYGDVGWTHRQLFLQEEGDRFLHEHAAFASLTRRDSLTKKTSLTSFYNLRASFADPETSSRLRNTLGLSLRHNVTPTLQASLTGRMTLTNFTQQSRQDFYTQGLAQLSYKISKNVRLSAFGSLTRGNSSNRRVDFDNSTVGVSLSGNVKLF